MLGHTGVVAVDAIGLLHEPVRRAVYEYVAGQREPVGRDDVAAAVGIGRALAAFHLDKLAAAGLLTVSYARRSGRTGPGAGRTAKLYRRAVDEITLSVPPREYGTLAAILAEAAEVTGADAAARDAAYRYGVRRGRELTRDPTGASAGTTGVDSAQVLTGLGGLGYEPVIEGAEVRLRNCPYGAVAHAFPPLVCGLNLSLVRGLLAGADLPENAARLDPRPDGCCVALRRHDRASS